MNTSIARNGLTLIEILVAGCLFAILILPLWSTLIQSQEILQMGIRELEVLSIGHGFLAQVRGIPATRFRPTATGSSGNPGFLAFPDPDPNGNVTLSGGVMIEMPAWSKTLYALRYAVSDFCRPGFNKLTRWIELEISWKDTTGSEKIARFPVLLIEKTVL